MGNNIQTFEVRVVVKKKGSMHFSSHIGVFIEDSITKMFHIDARTSKQARHKAEKYGRPLSVCKVADKLISNHLPSLESLQPSNPYTDAIAMDEMVWMRKSKRAERIESRGKDKNGH